MLRVRLPLAFLAALGASPAVGGEISAHYLNWRYDVAGSATDSDSRFDFGNDLDIDVRQRSLIDLSWNTGPGWWPDLALVYVPIRAGGQKSVTTDSSVLGIPTGSTTTEVVADANLDDVGLSLSYPLHLGPLTLSLGATVKHLEGTTLLQEEGDDEQTRETIGETFPMAHLATELRPWHWLRLGVSGDYASRGDDRASGYRAQLALRLGDISIAAGWQERSYRVQGSAYLIDTDLSGAFAGLGFILR
jgi:hypothetical protein